MVLLQQLSQPDLDRRGSIWETPARLTECVCQTYNHLLYIIIRIFITWLSNCIWLVENENWSTKKIFFSAINISSCTKFTTYISIFRSYFVYAYNKIVRLGFYVFLWDIILWILYGYENILFTRNKWAFVDCPKTHLASSVDCATKNTKFYFNLHIARLKFYFCVVYPIKYMMSIQFNWTLIFVVTKFFINVQYEQLWWRKISIWIDFYNKSLKRISLILFYLKLNIRYRR